MKRKKTFILCIIAAVEMITIAVAIINTGIGSRITTLPSVDDVVAIEIHPVENSKEIDPVRIVERSDIETIISALSTARQTSFSWISAGNERPLQTNYLMIYFYYDDVLSDRLSIYGGDTVYEEYRGIYKINGSRYDEMYQTYAGLKN